MTEQRDNTCNNATETPLGGSDSSLADNLWHVLVGTEGIRCSSIYPRGALVFAQGQEATGIYLLRSGRAKVLISSPEGKIVILRVADAGAVLGLHSGLAGAPYDVSVETLETSRIDFVSRADFMKVLNKSETTRDGAVYLLADELSDLIDRARSLLLSQSALEKLARLLLRFSAGAEGTTAKRAPLKLELTHEEIAQMICASRETVTRLLAELRRKEIVSLANNSISVRDWKALKSMAHYRAIRKTS